MQKVRNLHELKKLPASAGFVMVQNNRKIYTWHDGWIEKCYFTPDDVTRIMDLPPKSIYSLMGTIGIAKRKNRNNSRIKISLQQFRLIQKHLRQR